MKTFQLQSMSKVITYIDQIFAYKNSGISYYIVSGLDIQVNPTWAIWERQSCMQKIGSLSRLRDATSHI